MDKDIVIKKENTPAVQAETLISQAIEKGVPVETMEKLLAMRRELKAEFAKEAYDKAMAEFQKSCPVISKNRAVKDKNGDTRYNFAPLDSIVKQLGTLIADNGFSYTIKIVNDEKGMTAICKITHAQGHSEESPFFVPIGSEAYMTDVQKYGARSTFAKRYAFCNAFGILTGDEDSDAVDTGAKKETKKKETVSFFTQAENLIAGATKIEYLVGLQKKVNSSKEFNPEEKSALNAQINAKAKALK